MRITDLFKIVFTLCLFLGLAFFLPVTAQQAIRTTAPSPLGKLVDLGGRRLHINCTGKGNVTIVMEAGAGDFSFDWSLVQPKVASFARVCTYDRAGYAWSEAGPTPRTMRQIVYELHTGLAKAGIKSPYVLVGHSLGGLIVRVYANQYPKEVAGMVLVDSSHEDQQIIIMDRKTKKEKVVHWRELSSGRPIPSIQTTMPSPADSNTSRGTTQSANQSKLDAPYDKLPLKIQHMRLWAMAQPRYDAARSSETFEFLADELAGMYAERGSRKYPLGDMPLIVLTRGIAGEDEQANKQLLEDHDRLQIDLVSLSNNSKQIIAKQSGHHIQLEQPTLVTDAIKQVVNAVRRKTKLH
jgi:pimeloyl-ACP methyl ester carboxylesterase